MSHPRSYVWPSVVIGLLIALVVIQGTKLYHASKVPTQESFKECCDTFNNDCVLLQRDIDQINQKLANIGHLHPCTCDHAELLKQIREARALAEELRRDHDALFDDVSQGRSLILQGRQDILDRFERDERRIDKLEGRKPIPKPPVRRQASCGAHPPSCEGIAALGADGEPDSVTGIHLCATATPWYPGQQAIEWYQAERLASLKRRQERIEKRKMLLQFLFGACG